jgi:hypothetical protein
MEKLDSLTGRGATRVMLSVFEGMGRSVKEREGVGGSGEAAGREEKPCRVTRSCESRRSRGLLARFDYDRRKSQL